MLRTTAVDWSKRVYQSPQGKATLLGSAALLILVSTVCVLDPMPAQTEASPSPEPAWRPPASAWYTDLHVGSRLTEIEPLIGPAFWMRDYSGYDCMDCVELIYPYPPEMCSEGRILVDAKGIVVRIVWPAVKNGAPVIP